MRLVLVAVLALAAGAASAQARFVESCVLSTEGQEGLAAAPDAVCGCAAEAAVASGATADALDALIDHVREDGTFDAEAMPDETRATADVAVRALLTCALLGGDTAGAAAAMAPTSARPGGPPSGRPRSGAPVRRTEQAGAGAAIRIVG